MPHGSGLCPVGFWFWPSFSLKVSSHLQLTSFLSSCSACETLPSPNDLLFFLVLSIFLSTQIDWVLKKSSFKSIESLVQILLEFAPVGQNHILNVYAISPSLSLDPTTLMWANTPENPLLDVIALGQSIMRSDRNF